MDNSTTPRHPAAVLKSNPVFNTKDALLSSSPGFGTPAYPVATRLPRPIAQPFTTNNASNQAHTILPIVLPPQSLRPVAFRTLTKKHNLTLTSAGLALLAQFVGKFCGSGWREESLAERLLDEIAKQWRKDNGNIIIDDSPDKKLRNTLKALESYMIGGRLDTGKISRNNGVTSGLARQASDLSKPDVNREDSQNSLGVSGLEIEDDDETEQDRSLRRDIRAYITVVSALEQPRLTYSTSKRMLEPATTAASILPPIQHKISMFRNRYHLVHQRLLRNESFQTPSFATTFAPPKLLQSGSTLTTQQSYKITPISNLLGRTGTSHLLLGLLVNTAAGDLAVADLSSSVVLDMSLARSIPEDGAWFCPGMMVLVEGLYNEDGSNTSLGSAGGVGGQIRGRFLVDTMAGPPAERREFTLGINSDVKRESSHVAGAGFGWVDFLGVGSEKATGADLRRVRQRLLKPTGHDDGLHAHRTKMVFIGECTLDNPRTIDAIRAILSSYISTQNDADRPISVVLMGNFASAASMAGSAKGGGSIEYKENFDQLAGMLSEFPSLLSSSTLIFVPGDNDAWASSFAAGAATMLPRQGIPDLFTSRIRRAIATANAEAGLKENDVPGQAVWTSNPARISLFGSVEEILIFRDDLTSRLRRNAVMFPRQATDDPEEADQESFMAEIEARPTTPDTAVRVAASHVPKIGEQLTPPASTITARKLVKTILDQGHVSPFPTSIRPVFWDYASSLNVYPLPTGMILADAEVPPFAITYEGCHVMNPGRVLDDLGMRKGVAKWIEYDVGSRRGIVRDVRF